MNNIKDINKYIKNLHFLDDKYSDIITVEHRSNNPKRDFLFVNKIQGKHIPCSPSKTLSMCRDLAHEVEKSLSEHDKVLVIGFAETATAIGNIVAESLKQCEYVISTTREYIDETIGKRLIAFEEEHSHATNQEIYVWNEVVQELNNINYILFVEDEISTGNTIMNCIKAFKSGNCNLGVVKNKDMRFGVASICNWQNEENKRKFKESNIETFSLVTGELVSTDIKMGVSENDLKCCETLIENKNEEFNLRALKRCTGSFFRNRIGRSVNYGINIAPIARSLDIKDVKSVRVIGTEECMFSAIRIAEYLENKGIDTVCHSTTRSKIDVLQNSSDCKSEITSRLEFKSPYDSERDTYLYNVDAHTDLTVIVTDTMDFKSADIFYNLIGGYLKSKCGTINIIFI